jgi:hypothetical protein
MKQNSQKFERIEIKNKGYGKLNGCEIFITKTLYRKLKSRKSRTGLSFIQLLELGRAIRGFKHLLENIKNKNESSRLILTDKNTKKFNNDYYINLDGYRKKVNSRFFSFYRTTGLDASLAYLSEEFPDEFKKPKDSLTKKDLAKSGKHFAQLIDELSKKREHKKQLLRKTSELVLQYQYKSRLLREEIAELEEIKNKSNIVYYSTKIKEFKSRLGKNYKESSWQSWIYNNNWIIGVQYNPPIEKEKVGFKSIPDYLFPTLDGFIDILEIKLPNHEVIKKDQSHPGSYAWSPEANRAIGQVVHYLYEMELHQLELQRDINRAYSTKLSREIYIIKPRAFILIGRDDDWDDSRKEAFRKLNHALHDIEVITYTDLIKRGEKIIALYSNDYADIR